MPRKTSMNALSAQASGATSHPVHERDREPEKEAERAARAPAQDRDAKAADKRGRIFPQQIRAHRPLPAARRRSVRLAQRREAQVDREVEQPSPDIGFERPIGLRGDVHTDAGQFGDADHRDQRRGLEQKDELIDERRDRDPERLRHENAPPDVEPCKSERGRRLTLAVRNGVERAAQDFRLEGGRRQREPAHRGDDSRHVKPVFGEKVIDEQELHEQRNATKDADINCAKALKPSSARDAGHAHGGANQETEDDAGERNNYGRRRRMGEIAERVEDDLRLHRAAL